MFPNLEAEQARKKHTNEFVARELSISRQSYESKKRTGGFKLVEINRLLAIYSATYDYLFAIDGGLTQSPTPENAQAV